MKRLPQTPQLLAVAERVVWFKPPAEALADPVHFLAHVMTYGTVEDPEGFRYALEECASRHIRCAFLGLLES